MKKYLVFLILINISLFSCRKNTADDSPKLPPANRAESLRLEFEPENVISFKRAGGNSEMINFIISQIMATKAIKTYEFKDCVGFLTEMDSAIVISADTELNSGKSKDGAYLGISGIKVDNLITCLNKTSGIVSSGSTNGFTIWRAKKDNDESLLIAKADRLAVIDKSLEMRITPGKGMLGSIQFEKFLSEHNFFIKLNKMKDADFLKITGFIDAKNKLTSSIELLFKNKLKVDQIMKQWETVKKSAHLMVPMKGMKEIIAGISLTQSGETLYIKTEHTLEDLKNILTLINSFGKK